jgi:hypothetical protein
MMHTNASEEELHGTMDDRRIPYNWEKGITHMTRDEVFYSGNLRGFLQHRQLISGHVVPG